MLINSSPLLSDMTTAPSLYIVCKCVRVCVWVCYANAMGDMIVGWCVVNDNYQICLSTDANGLTQHIIVYEKI